MKIFGTGMQRTGTTSLASALTTLGFKTRDYPQELFVDLDDPIIRKFEAFTDNPIPLLYQELDRRHPGSKFVHTYRDEADWLKSVQWLFTVGREKFNPPLAREQHLALYGRTDFDQEVFLERYRRHNREVREYFANRPGDILFLDITKGEGFDKLCLFLGRPAPANAQFPHRNQAESLWRVRAHKIYRLVRDRWRRTKRSP